MQHPPAYFAGLTDLNCENKAAVREVVDLLRGVPVGLGDILAHCWTKANPHALGGITDKDAEAMTMALAKVIGREGAGHAYAEQGEAFDAIDAEHVDLACLDHAGVQVQGASLEKELVGVDHPLVRPITAIVHDAQALVLLAGISRASQKQMVGVRLSPERLG